MNKYESHITVMATDLSSLQHFCNEKKLKCLTIELECEGHPLQSMTSSFHYGPQDKIKGEIN